MCDYKPPFHMTDKMTSLIAEISEQVGRITVLQEGTINPHLSHDDELQGESNSISNQKAMLEDYAEKNGFTGIRHFTDDGISGTTFEREGLQSMLAEVEKGNIGTIIVKDMSRLERNYVQMGMLREKLRRADQRPLRKSFNTPVLIKSVLWRKYSHISRKGRP